MDREYLLNRHRQELQRAREVTSVVAKKGHGMLAQAFLDAIEEQGSSTVVQFIRHEPPATNPCW